MDNTQHVQWEPADIMQRIPVQGTTYENGTTTRHNQWERRIQSERSIES